MSDAIEAAVDAFRHSTFNALTRDECRDAVRAALTAYEAAKGGDVGVRDIIQHALGRLAIFREMLPEEDEPWESWYAAAFDMVSVEIDTILSALTSPASGERDAVTQAAADVLAERKRQVEAEGWMPGHDDGHTSGELAQAAAAYSYYCTDADNSQPPAESIFPTTWDESWWKPSDHRRNLVKAGALILAEIERLDRAALRMEGK